LFGGLGLGGTGTRTGFLGFFAFLGLIRLLAAAAAFCCTSVLACWLMVAQTLSEISFHSAN
jgi:hypothetical protein